MSDESTSLKLKIQALESGFEFLKEVDAIYADFPAAVFLNRSSGEVVYPESEEELEAFEEDDDLLGLPEDLLEDVDDYALMESFVSDLSDEPVRERLEQAIKGKGAFRNFRDIVRHDGEPKLHHEWTWYQALYLRKLIVGWLEENGIEPEWDGELFQIPEWVPPTAGSAFRDAADAFALAAKRLQGVQRISLLGDLAAARVDPDDLMVLVRVADEMPMEELAMLGRKFQGRVTNARSNLLVTVFIANDAGVLIGTLCRYRECGANIRIACASASQTRPYLHVELGWPTELLQQIQNPPVNL